MDYKQLNEDFLKAYHEPKIKEMVLGIRKILYERLEAYSESNHYKALDHFLDMADAIDICGGHDLPGMLYGMISNAWDKFFEEVKGAPVNLADYSWETHEQERV